MEKRVFSDVPLENAYFAGFYEEKDIKEWIAMVCPFIRKTVRYDLESEIMAASLIEINKKL